MGYIFSWREDRIGTCICDTRFWGLFLSFVGGLNAEDLIWCRILARQPRIELGKLASSQRKVTLNLGAPVPTLYLYTDEEILSKANQRR